MSGIELAPGSKLFTARCKNLYILTTKHKITARNKINKIKIENPFEKIITVIDNNDYSYKEIDIEEDLEIVKERLSTSSVPNTFKRATSSRMSTSKRKYEIPQSLCNDLFSRFEQQTLILEKLAEATDRQGHDGPSQGLVSKHLQNLNWVLKIDSLNFVTEWQDGPSQV